MIYHNGIKIADTEVDIHLSDDNMLSLISYITVTHQSELHNEIVNDNKRCVIRLGKNKYYDIRYLSFVGFCTLVLAVVIGYSL